MTNGRNGGQSEYNSVKAERPESASVGLGQKLVFARKSMIGTNLDKAIAVVGKIGLDKNLPLICDSVTAKQPKGALKSPSTTMKYVGRRLRDGVDKCLQT